MKKILLASLIFTSFFSMAEKSNILVSKEKFEIVIVEGVETRFKTETLKPIMIFEEVITIDNVSKTLLKSIIYDFELDKKSELYTNMDLGEDINILYSNNDGLSFSEFPILESGKEIPMSDYTTVRMTIDAIPFEGRETVKVRYSYDHFKE